MLTASPAARTVTFGATGLGRAAGCALAWSCRLRPRHSELQSPTATASGSVFASCSQPWERQNHMKGQFGQSPLNQVQRAGAPRCRPRSLRSVSCQTPRTRERRFAPPFASLGRGGREFGGRQRCCRGASWRRGRARLL